MAETPSSQATTTPTSPPPVASVETQPEQRRPAGPPYWGTGRRKSAVARVRLLPGSGKIEINRRELDKYFTEPQEHLAVREPLLVVGAERQYDVFVNVRGGGHSGQAGAIRLGIARALVLADPKFEETLREHRMLTRDARVVERKKYGRRKARRSFQFSKR